MKSYRKLSAALLLTGGAILAGCAGKEDLGKFPAPENPIHVSVATPSGKGQIGNIDVSGQVESAQSATISTRVMGYINRVYVKTGDHVRQGQLLFSVNSNDIAARLSQSEAGIAQAEAAFASAEKDYDRFRVLYKEQSASAKEMDNATLQFNAAKAGLDAARQMRNEVGAQLTYANVTAPFNGVITQKLLDAGNIATPGMPVLAMEGEGQMQVSASVPETQISAIRQGSEVSMDVRAAGKKFSGAVTQISRSSELTGGQYTVKISIPMKDQANLYSGMYVNAAIVSPSDKDAGSHNDMILVPSRSIVYKGELAGLYTVGQNSQALLRWVRLGKTYGDMIEVLSGLGANEQFIVQAEGKLFNDAPITIGK